MKETGKQDERVKEILNQIIRYSNGDFNSPLKISATADATDEVSNALNSLGESLKTRDAEIKHKEHRINILLDILLKYTILDFSVKATISETGDEIDAMGAGLNALGEELVFHTSRLKDSEEQIKIIFENAPDAVVVTDTDGIIRRWNPAAERIFGWKENEVSGKYLYNIIIPERYREGYISAIAHFLKTGEATSLKKTIEVTSQHKDKSEIEIEMSVSPAKLKDEYTFICFLRDITERKRAEELITRLNNTLEKRVAERTVQLHESEKKYRNLFENNPMPMWLLELPSLRFLDVNESAIDLYGYSREEFLSMTTLDIRPTDEKERLIQLYRPHPGPFNTGIWKHLKKDGKIMYAEVTVHDIIFNGKPCRLVLSVDVTERKKAEEALRESEARFRRIFESKMIGLLFWGKGRNITQANDFFLEHIRYTRDDLERGKISWTNLIAPEYASFDRHALDQIRGKGVSEPYEIEFICKDGSRLPVLVGAAALTGNDAETGVAYIMDISQRKKMEEEILNLNKDLEQRIASRTEQLQTVNKELESFSYTVSHDLRAPLRAIIGYSQMLLEDYGVKLDEEAVRLINTVRFNAKRMGQLVDDLLEFSRMGKKELNETSSDLTRIVENVIKEINPVERQRVEIIVHPLGRAKADHSLMQHVFQNLIQNAVKYSSKKQHPVVEIGTSEINGEKVYYVKDNGAGFDMAYYNKLFGVFHRLHRQEEFEGTGVGLAIVQRIILRHGGKIWADAKVNEGATFYFTLNNSPSTDKM